MVLDHPFTIPVADPKVVLRHCKAPFGSKFVQPHPLRIVLFHPFAKCIHKRKITLCEVGVSAWRSFVDQPRQAQNTLLL
jgi:hypothetical protein